MFRFRFHALSSILCASLRDLQIQRGYHRAAVVLPCPISFKFQDTPVYQGPELLAKCVFATSFTGFTVHRQSPQDCLTSTHWSLFSSRGVYGAVSIRRRRSRSTPTTCGSGDDILCSQTGQRGQHRGVWHAAGHLLQVLQFHYGCLPKCSVAHLSHYKCARWPECFPRRLSVIRFVLNRSRAPSRLAELARLSDEVAPWSASGL